MKHQGRVVALVVSVLITVIGLINVVAPVRAMPVAPSTTFGLPQTGGIVATVWVSLLNVRRAPRITSSSKGRLVKGDAEPEKGFYYRSDHFNFAKQGVPAIDVHSGSSRDFLGKPAGYADQVQAEWTEHDYHQPSDVVTADWDLSGTREDLKAFLAVGYRVAQADRFPEWTPGTEFRAKRDQQLRK